MPSTQGDRSRSVTGKTPSAEELFETAAKAAESAYAPYSKLCVGAAVLSEQGNIYSGCNVENVSFSLVSCAERNAIAAAVRAEGSASEGESSKPKPFKLKAIAVATKNRTPINPCGACRQVIREFGSDARVVYLAQDGTMVERRISELLPDSFSSLMLDPVNR